MLVSLAAGFSSINEHEQSQGAVTNVIAGTVFPSDQYGTIKRNQHGQPVTDADAELEKRNHAYAVEKCRKMLDGKNGARAWGRPMHAFTGSKSESIDDEAILKYRDQSGGCSCKGDCSTKRCGKCHAKNVPCTFRCACKGKCKNPSPTPELQGVTAAERASLTPLQISYKLTPQDWEFFAVKHALICRYTLQFKLCTDTSCWYCPHHNRIKNLTYLPYYSVPNGQGGFIPFAERVAMLQDPKTSKVATELFLTDKYLPAKCLKMAFDKSVGCPTGGPHSLQAACCLRLHRSAQPSKSSRSIDFYTLQLTVNVKSAAALMLCMMCLV